MARLYFFMEHPRMVYFSDLLAPADQRRFHSFGVVVGILGGLHAVHLVLHIVSSIRARALAVWPRTAIVKRGIEFLRGLSKGRKVTTPTQQTKGREAMRAFVEWKNGVDIEGRYFELGFVLQKVVEIVAQIEQCRRYSSLISRVWINQAFVGIVVANCILTALLNHLMLAATSRAKTRVAPTGLTIGSSSIRERTLCVAMDALLSTISCLVLPLTIFVDWALQFDSDLWTFPTEILYGDTAFTRLVYENQAIFALSAIDGIAKLVPHASVLLSLTSISFILERSSPNATCSMTASSARQQSELKSRPTIRLTVATLLQHVVTSVGFFTAAAVVLALHFEAEHLVSNADPSIAQMCLESVRPWFAQNVSCSVVKYNCYRHGVASRTRDVLENLQRETLTSIIFAHCSAFKMLASIRDFPNLLGIEIWNVTLERWGPEAALSADLHPKMVFLIMAYANMTTLPQGVLSPPLPDLLSDIEIVSTNLTIIPEEVGDVWINLQVLYVENSPLEEFPTALFRLPLSDVSLVNTHGFEGTTRRPLHVGELSEYLRRTGIIVQPDTKPT
ncbi:hypothetical protein PF003_g33082 [Phytophthora fragariae]|nr:hypothetical protein PF003_g33082 [Phytophthora fragariae]